MSNTNYFSVSELAALGNVSRQTILYYDKHNLLKPNFIDSNGYRYYHFKEYLILEIILNFRKLGMSVDEIKAYINEKSPEALDNILMNKATEYELTIKKLKCLLADIEIVRTNLAAINKYNVGSLTIHQQEQEILILSPLVDKKAPIKTRIKILGNFNLPLYKSNHFKSCKVSWIITANDFLNGECRKKRYYCSPTYVDSNNKKITFINMLLEKLNIKDVITVCDRAENYMKDHLNEFDIVLSRAVAYADIITSLSVPFIKKDGVIILMKGSYEGELKVLNTYKNELNISTIDIINYDILSNENNRSLIVIKKNNESSKVVNYAKLLKQSENRKKKLNLK